MKHHNQGNLQKKKFLWDYSAKRIKFHSMQWRQQTVGKCSKNWGLTSPAASRKKRESTGMVLGIKTSKSSPRPHVPYSPNSATNGDCIFKHLNLGRAFKPQRTILSCTLFLLRRLRSTRVSTPAHSRAATTDVTILTTCFSPLCPSWVPQRAFLILQAHFSPVPGCKMGLRGAVCVSHCESGSVLSVLSWVTEFLTCPHPPHQRQKSLCWAQPSNSDFFFPERS